MGQDARRASLTLLGAAADMHLRIIAILSKASAESETCANSCRIDTQPPTPAHRGQAGLFGRVCRFRCGLPAEHIQLPTAAPVEAPQPLEAQSGRRVQASQVISQMDDAGISALGPDNFKHAYNRYNDRTGTFRRLNSNAPRSSSRRRRRSHAVGRPCTLTLHCGGRSYLPACRSYRVASFTMFSSSELQHVGEMHEGLSDGVHPA